MVPAGDRQPLLRPLLANEAWSMDFFFDRTAEGRTIKYLTVMDEPTDEALTIVPRRAINGEPLTQTFDRLWFERGLSRVIQSDSSKEFCARAMLNWTHQCNDPAEPAQLTPLKRRPQQAFSCRAPDAGAGGYRNRSSR